MPVQVLQEFVAKGRPNRPGTPLSPTSVTIHNTDNANPGAGAINHSKFVRNTGNYVDKQGKVHWVSWHYTVDDKYIIQQLPVNERAWHAGPGNATSIAIEICMNSDMDANLAYHNAAALVASLVTDLDLTPEQVRTHESWTGKKCPSVLLAGDGWSKFLQLVGEALSSHGLTDSGLALTPEERAAVETVEVDDSEHDIDHDLLRAALAPVADAA